MNRFFIDPLKILDSKLDIHGDDAGHITRVLRLGIGDSIELCDGIGNDYHGTITKANKTVVTVELGQPFMSLGEPKTRVTLYQGLTKGSKMDMIIEKCVELGIYSIIPMETHRAISSLSEKGKAQNKILRWQKRAQGAAKQSKRGIIPQIHLPVTYNEAIKVTRHSLKLILWEDERQSSLKGYLTRLDKGISDIGVAIGPEGGFSRDEIELAKDNGWESITLGPRILRTETAGMATLAAIMFYMGEMQ